MEAISHVRWRQFQAFISGTISGTIQVRWPWEVWIKVSAVLSWISCTLFSSLAPNVRIVMVAFVLRSIPIFWISVPVAKSGLPQAAWICASRNSCLEVLSSRGPQHCLWLAPILMRLFRVLCGAWQRSTSRWYVWCGDGWPDFLPFWLLVDCQFAGA